MAGCIVRQLLFCTFVYTCYTSHYNKRLLTYLLTQNKFCTPLYVFLSVEKKLKQSGRVQETRFVHDSRNRPTIEFIS